MIIRPTASILFE